MSKFLKALEQAERERALRAHNRRQKDIPTESKEQDAPPLAKKDSAILAPELSESLPDVAVVEGPAEARTLVSEPGSARQFVRASRNRIERHMVSLLNPVSFEAEQYRTLRYMVEHVHKEVHLRVVAITSPASEEGKTTTAINLAGALAQAPEARVLLIDADLRRPMLKEHLGIMNPNGPGLVDAILKPKLALRDIERRLAPFNLSVLLAGQSLANPYEVLKSSRLVELLEEARQRYDYIVMDTPPLVPVLDCRVIGKYVDAFVMVVAAHKTPRKLLEEALNIMDPAKLVGLIFNNDDRPLSGYYGYYYDRDRSSADGPAKGSGRGMKKIHDLLHSADPFWSRIKQVATYGSRTGAP